MNANPFFSIIIPTYNRAHTIRRTVNSCLLQEFADFEVIIVDDGSTDNTREIIQDLQYDNRVKYFKIENSERAVARNHGISMARGEYLTFLDSDDLLYPDFLTNANAVIATKNKPSFFNLSYEVRDDADKLKFRFHYHRSNDFYLLVPGNQMSCIGNFIHKKVTEEYKFNEDSGIIRSEDWELWVRITARYGYEIDKKVSCCVYDHQERSVRNYDVEKLIKNKYRAIQSAFSDKNVIEKYGKYKRRILAYSDTYISLHLALAGQKKKSFRFLMNGVVKYPGFVFSRRFMAIVKHILFVK